MDDYVTDFEELEEIPIESLSEEDWEELNDYFTRTHEITDDIGC